AVLFGRRLLGRRHPLFAALVLGSVWGYALLVGIPMSVLRAAVMATLMVTAALVGRQNSGLPALLGTAAVMAMLDPLSPWDLGYQLGFLAMGGILFMAPLLETCFWRALRISREERQSAGAALAGLAVTGVAGILGATAATLPVALLNFTTHALLALPTTLFAVPALPAVLLAGGAAGIFGALADGAVRTPLLATLLEAPAWLGTAGATLASSLMMTVVQFGASLPLASVPVPRAPEWLVWGYAAGVSGLLVGVNQRFGVQLRSADRAPSWSPQRLGLGRRGVWGIAAVGVLAAGVAVGKPDWALHDGRLHLWAFDIPNGDATLVRTPGGVKRGPDPAALTRALGSVLPFWDRDIPWLVLTAPRRDRLAGSREALARYRVQTVVEGPGVATTAEYQEWERLLAERGVRRVRLDVGVRVELEPGGYLEALAVPTAPTGRNAAPRGSVALRLVTPSGEVLLLGDPDDQIIEDLAEHAAELSGRTVKVYQRADGAQWPAALLTALAPAMLVLSGDGAAAAPTDTPQYAAFQHGTVEAVLDPGGGWATTAR
ncbi:MAG: ComEC/Rec2 family competence protein, partial [Chloroflexi bacterium]|nr:ComEC/Rec2 family competence protein [Chloroflexota bacterium]